MILTGVQVRSRINLFYYSDCIFHNIQSGSTKFIGSQRYAINKNPQFTSNFLVRSGAQYSQVIRIFDMLISRDEKLYEPHRNNFIT